VPYTRRDRTYKGGERVVKINVGPMSRFTNS